MSTLRDLQARLGTPKEFAAHVRRQLYLHKITQRALAEEAGIEKPNLNRFLRCRRGVSFMTMWKIDEALTRLLYGKRDSDQAA